MSQHEARLSWTRGQAAFTYETYVRDHRLELGSGSALDVSAAEEFKGNPRLTNPEELLVGALSSCHMLTFLAVAAKKGLAVERYEDHAVGVLERPEGAPMHVTRVTLRPKVTFSGEAPDAATLEKLHAQAHRGCFIANSVKTEVTVERAE